VKQPPPLAERSNTFPKHNPDDVYGVQDKRLAWIRQKLLPAIKRNGSVSTRASTNNANSVASENTPRTARDIDVIEENEYSGYTFFSTPDHGPFPKSAMRRNVSDRGRKSVTIVENDERALSPRNSLRTSANGRAIPSHETSWNSTQAPAENMNLSSSTRRSSLNPELHDELPNYGEQRPITPVEHPKPVLHPGIPIFRRESLLPDIHASLHGHYHDVEM